MIYLTTQTSLEAFLLFVTVQLFFYFFYQNM